ncbi:MULTISPECIES: HipA family kinase [unclassified Bradyrhizobium]|uniref:HipA family kinase n=1 Tax=unclassified Bradyrhizobium TaxID=2631580 RepID=UPI0028E90A7A|nr:MULTISPECIES: HipA family kinase [unclassified Bradyrhizobium]
MNSGQQLQLFHRRALIVFPPAMLTADSMGEVEADDGLRYYVKSDVHGKAVRASEWISTHLAEAVGIAAPNPVTMQMPNGEVVFGSRRIIGVADQLQTQVFLSTPSIGNVNQSTPGLGILLSKIYALDLFLFNDDRHANNYLSVNDNGVQRLYAFDFSRALFWHWPWAGYPPPQCNTRRVGAILRSHHGFDLVAANSVLDALAAFAPASLQGFINQMPADWLPASLHAQFMSVWTAGARQSRIDDIRKGLSDGSLL